MPDHFEDVPLPRWLPGCDVARLKVALRAWVDSPPMHSLVEMSGWVWPKGESLRDVTDALSEMSRGWDFRAIGRQPKERDSLAGGSARVGDRVLEREPVEAAAAALGLATAHPLADSEFDHVVVLSGLLTACLNRTRYAAELINKGLTPGMVWVLAGHRDLTENERKQSPTLGLAEIDNEAQVAIAAAQEAFGLSDPVESWSSWPETAPPERAQEEFRSGAERHTWSGLELLVVPSAEPALRRVNTMDQLRYWADHARLRPTDRVLIITTQIYVPFQHFDAIRLLGLDRGCGIATTGVDATTASIPLRPFGAESYLQEVRSALRSAASLLRAVEAAGAPHG